MNRRQDKRQGEHAMPPARPPQRRVALAPEGSPLRYVFTRRLRCPACDSAELRHYRTQRDGETISRHTRCVPCGHRFILVAE
jgi:hypothetical protein